MGENKKFCRLCLTVIKNNFQKVEEVTKDIFDVLLLKINFAISKEPVICTHCAESLQKFFEFKSTCLFTEDKIVPLTNTLNADKIDLLEVAYFNSVENMSSADAQIKSICRFCMQYVDKETCIEVDALEDDFEKDVVAKCLPELNLKLTKKPGICSTCIESLMGYYGFMTTCLDVEKNISNYCKSEKIKKKDKVNLSNIYRFVITNTLNQDDLCNTSIDIKTEAENEEPILTMIKNEEIKMEEECFERSLPPSSKTTVICGLSGKRSTGIRCKNCSYTTRNKYHMERHLSVHLDPSERITFDCDLCNVKCSTRSVLNAHKLKLHNDNCKMYSCQECSYTTRHRGDLKKHAVCHQQPKEEDFFRCDKCSFITLRKEAIRLHVMRHLPKNYHCKQCSYSAFTRSRLKKHSLVHQKEREIVGSCDQCDYKTINRDSLRAHISTKHGAQASLILRCYSCDYTTTHKKNLARHVVVHKSQSEQIYKCKSCTYQTKSKVAIKDHMLNHNPRISNSTSYTMGQTGLELFECYTCGQKFKSKSTLWKHIVLKHEREKINLALLEPDM